MTILLNPTFHSHTSTHVHVGLFPKLKTCKNSISIKFECEYSFLSFLFKEKRKFHSKFRWLSIMMWTWSVVNVLILLCREDRDDGGERNSGVMNNRMREIQGSTYFYILKLKSFWSFDSTTLNLLCLLSTSILPKKIFFNKWVAKLLFSFFFLYFIRNLCLFDWRIHKWSRETENGNMG